ncbi:MAG TPA: glycosyl hydrolase family 28 protein [Opitutaceae bacterium]|nr:glycosyl hydrolase family 28 protein [Opitutaceae bacterium]
MKRLSVAFAALALSFLLVSGCLSPNPASKTFPITEHGAVGDGQTVNTKAIQALIDECAKNGGGTIVVPKGTFLSGALYFKPGVNLRVDKDAVLKSTTNIEDFPAIYTRWEGIERYWTSAFLNFVGMKNVSVSGEGTIDASGDAWSNFGQGRGGRGAGAPGRGGPNAGQPGAAARGNTPGRGPNAASANAAAPAAPIALPKPQDVYPSPLPTTATISLAPDRTNTPIINAAGIALPRGGFGGGNGSGGISINTPPRSIVFQNCTGVRISGLTLKNEARWGYVFIYCEDVVAANLTAKAEHYIPSSDGMDVDSCRKVLITGCYFDCNDDCISIKSGKDEDGLRVARPCEDIVIEKTTFAYGHGGAAMGSETSGGIRNVEVRDCIVEADNWAPVRFKSQPSRGGVVENITYRNIELRSAREVVEFNMAWRMVPPIAPPAKVLPIVRNVRIINLHGTATNVGSMHGLPDSFIDGITFENCNIVAQRGLTIENAKNVDTSGLKITVKEGEPIIRR